MRCGPEPAAACHDDREAIPNWFAAVARAIGGFPPRQATWVLGHAFQLHHPGSFLPAPSLMADQSQYPATGLLPHERLVLEHSPFFREDAFDAAAPFLDLENPDEVRIGSTIELTGRGFAPGDVVEFADADHRVRVEPEVLDAGRLRAVVPAGLTSGFVRVLRGPLRGNALTVNVEPRLP
jgi:hypothetical protein